MSVRQKLLFACLGFVLIIALLGLVARQQSDQLGRLTTNIYDHSLIGTTYASQAEAQFLRLIAHHDADTPFSTAGKRAELQAVLDRLDVAIERASTEHTRSAAVKVRAMLAALPDAPVSQLSVRVSRVDGAIAKLVQKYDSDGLRSRDAADDMVARGGRQVLMEVAVSFAFAIGLGLLLGHNLAPPLVSIVGVIRHLTEGDLQNKVPPRLSRRKDEIGAVARATMFFRETMLKNIAAGEERARLQAESEAARLNAELSKMAIAAKSEFLATMSHEIRTPMNGVATIADLLADTPLSADQLKMVNIIRQSSKWLIRVINDILDFSKLEAHQLQIENTPFMLDEVIDSSRQVLDAKAREKGLSLTTEGRDLAGICRIGDPLRLRQILLNLLGNAVKFTAKGGVRLVLDAHRDGFSLSVIDTGMGIPEDKIGSLFQPYNQLRSDIARSYGGTGLGLSITRNLIDLMGGSLSVTSALGKGSCFTVNLALPSGAASLCKAPGRQAEIHARWQKPDMAVAVARRAVVLCAEDNAINREVLARVLDRLGFNHEMAEDGVAALAMLDRARHGVVLTDAQMPGLDGWQLAEAIRRQEALDPDAARMPILMVTANVLSDSDSRVTAVGIDMVLAKPLNMADLQAKLLELVPALGTLRIACAQPEMAQPPSAPAPALPDDALDLDVLVQLVGDDPDDVSALLNDFLAGVIKQHHQIREALAGNDAKGVGLHAHSMKGAARYAGAKRLAEICQRLERRAHGGAALEDLSDDLAMLDASIERLPEEVAAAMRDWREKASVAVVD